MIEAVITYIDTIPNNVYLLINIVALILLIVALNFRLR